MDTLKPLEEKMDELLVKKAPVQIPENGKKWIVKYAPIIVLVIAVLSLLALFSLFVAIGSSQNYVNEINRIYGNKTVDFGLIYYLALVSLIVQTIILLMAYNPLKQKSKKGWDLLLLGNVISFLFGVLYVFTDSGTVANFIGNLVGIVIGLYVLAQIRSYYLKTPKTK